MAMLELSDMVLVTVEVEVVWWCCSVSYKKERNESFTGAADLTGDGQLFILTEFLCHRGILNLLK
jgi:hypothetical protein